MNEDGFVAWPLDVAAHYRERGIWRGVPLGEAIDQAMQTHGDSVALVSGARRLTFDELRRLSRRLASSFVRRGICDGARVVFQLPNTVEFVLAYVAALTVGAVPIACLPHHREAEIRPIASLTTACAWIFGSRDRHHEFLAMVERVSSEVPSLRELIAIGEAGSDRITSFDMLLADGSDDDPVLSRHVPDAGSIAVLQLSGGTTGIPKLIPRTHDDYAYNSLSFAEATGFTRDDVLLVPIPLAHNFPLACPGLQAALLLGARTVLASSPAADVVFPLIERERVTWVPAVPATLIQWTQHPARSNYDFTSLKSIYVGGQKLNPEPARAAIAAFGPVVRQVFGMAEGLLCGTRPYDDLELHLNTQGRPASDLDEIRIVDDSGNHVATGEIGELLCRGPYTLRGYYRAPEHNKTAFTADGFYRTGDLVRMHASGNIIVEGRKKDVINRGGEKIGAEEIENLMMKHECVAQAALVAVPDPTLGERACACVVLREGTVLDLPGLVTFLRQYGIATFKLPERLEIFEKLPLTGVGKVSKKDLRELVRERQSARTENAS